MSIARTVRGDVDAAALGVTDAHDHLIIRGGPATSKNPDLLLKSVDEAVFEAEAFRIAGGATIVDAMPTGAGRDPIALLETSSRAGVNIVTTSGFHKLDYYTDTHWARLYSEDVLLDLILQECENGIDKFDYAGPYVERTSVRPGLLKVAGDYNRLRSRETAWLHVMAQAQVRTGLPLLIHADHGTMAHRLVEMLLDDRVAPNRINVSHMDRNPDLHVHAALLEMGVNIIYDGLGRERYRPISSLADIIIRLEQLGFAERIMFGADMATRNVRLATGGIGIAALLTEFVPHLLRCGVQQKTVHESLTTVPQRALSIATPERHLTGDLAKRFRVLGE